MLSTMIQLIDFLNTPRYDCKHTSDINRPGVSDADRQTHTWIHTFLDTSRPGGRSPLIWCVCVCVLEAAVALCIWQYWCTISHLLLLNMRAVWTPDPSGRHSSAHSCGKIGPQFPECLFRVMVKGMSARREHYWAWPICSQMEYTLYHSANLCNWLCFGLNSLWLRLHFFPNRTSMKSEMHKDGRFWKWLLPIDMNYRTFWL